jgi:hypothetical protein
VSGPTVVIGAFEVARFVRAPGHLWVYLQYVQGLRALGCEVWWFERVPAAMHRDRVTSLVDRLEPFGLGDRLLLYADGDGERRWLNGARAHADDVIANADLLLNFHYGADPAVLAPFPRTALVDIDPGLLQLWMSEGQIPVAPHDLYFTTGDTVGTSEARFPDCGLSWLHIRPPVCLEQWPAANGNGGGAFTTISSWWGDEWVVDDGGYYENNKRVSFLRYADVPRRTEEQLELALSVGPGDAADVELMRSSGWRVRNALDVASTPEDYRDYVRSSRGEFSCAKPSCARLQNGWVSDRTLCYLASGRPAVVQHTGPNPCLDGGDGVLRFTTPDEAVAALEAVGADYDHHRRAARALAEEHFDARKVAARILELALD